ncbi:hypothetical protein PINS_up004656 [Pythium insidiosum]|nr:hypothetical protein PINS_up004656 [Pythium insidiosum]
MGDAESDSANRTPSTLHAHVQDVLKLICDAELIEKEVAAMKLDLKRLPLGRLSKAQISQGYTLLERMASTVSELAALAEPDEQPTAEEEEAGKPSSPPQDVPATTGVSTRRTRRSGGSSIAVAPRRSTRPRRTTTARDKRVRQLKDELKSLSGEFYSLIPHDFGRALPPIIDSLDEIKLKIDLLEVLADIEISQKLQRERRRAASSKSSDGIAIHPLDAQYKLLGVDLEPLAESEPDFHVLQRYVETTHAPTHIQYKLRIRSILRLRRPEEDAFAPTQDSIDNHQVSNDMEAELCSCVSRALTSEFSLVCVSCCGTALGFATSSASLQKDCAWRHQRLRRTATCLAKACVIVLFFFLVASERQLCVDLLCRLSLQVGQLLLGDARTTQGSAPARRGGARIGVACAGGGRYGLRQAAAHAWLP